MYSLVLGEDLCFNATLPSYIPFFSASFSILITVIASVGNSLVVIAVIWNPYKDLRTPFYLFVANLSIADLVVGSIAGPLSTLTHIIEGLHKIIQLRDTFIVACFILYTASLLSLTALALDRYLAIMHPVVYRANFNPVRAILVLVIVWIVSILLSMIYFIVGYYIYLFIFVNTAVAVIIVVLILTKSKILKYLRQQMQQWNTLHQSEENLIMKQLVMWEKKITNTLIIVMLLFLTFYLPSFIIIYIINLCTDCDCVFIHWMGDIQYLLLMAISAVNPFVFPWRLKRLRRVFRNIVTCHPCIKCMPALNHNQYQPL